MPLTLEQYVDFLDTRELVWPAPPEPQPPKAKPHLVRLPDIRVVAWNVYGTLLNIFSGQLLFEHPQQFVMEIALDKTVQEFNMWASMTRKPGQPSEYARHLHTNALSDLRLAPSHGEKHPEILAERVWENFLKKLKKDYKYDVGRYGNQTEYTRKIAYFFHASLQGTGCYEGAAQALEGVHHAGLRQGLLADAQCFTMIQLRRGLAQQHSAMTADQLLSHSLRALSYEVGGKKPSERLFKQFLTQAGVPASHILHVSSRLVSDLIPAKKLGMRTALFAGDKQSLQAPPEQLKDRSTRPDVLLTELTQIAEVVGL